MSDLIEKFLKLEENKSDNPFKKAKELEESKWRYAGGLGGALAGAGATFAATGNPVAGYAAAPVTGELGYHAGLKRDISNAKNKYEKNKEKFGEDHPETVKAKQKHESLLNKQSSDPVTKIASKITSMMKNRNGK